jgi:hypothetical protein
MSRFFLYLIRWQCSSPILTLCLIYLPLGPVWGAVVSNLVGGVLFFFIDKKIFKIERRGNA